VGLVIPRIHFPTSIWKSTSMSMWLSMSLSFIISMSGIESTVAVAVAVAVAVVVAVAVAVAVAVFIFSFSILSMLSVIVHGRGIDIPFSNRTADSSATRKEKPLKTALKK
jgi:hypothetical protein